VRIPLSYNLRNLRQRPASTLATALGIALVVAILVGALAMAAGFQTALVETGSPNNVIVLRTGADSEISSSITQDGANILRAEPEVAIGPDGHPLVSSEMVVLANLRRTGQVGSSNITLRGVDQEAFQLRDQVKIVSGHMFQPGTDEVIVGERIARRFADCNLGGHLRFNKHDFTVVGHFVAGGTGFESEIWGDNAILLPAMNRGTYQSVTFRLRGPPPIPSPQAGFSRYLARLFRAAAGHDRSSSRVQEVTRDEGALAFTALKQRLEKDPRLGVQVLTERQWYAQQSALLANVLRVAGIFLTLIMAVGAIFGAMNTMYAAVGARTREIATLMVLGFSPGSIRWAFVRESVFLSLIGGALGCLIALPINSITTSTTNWSSFSEVAFAFRVTPFSIVAGMIFAVAMGFFGGLLPAYRAGRLPLASGLRAI
jgi:ABC-type lipoprotein release transport system permease subunit